MEIISRFINKSPFGSIGLYLIFHMSTFFAFIAESFLAFCHIWTLDICVNMYGKGSDYWTCLSIYWQLFLSLFSSIFHSLKNQSLNEKTKTLTSGRLTTKHVRENILCILQSLSHLLISRLQCRVQGIRQPLMLFIHISNNPQLRAQNDLRRVLKYHLDHFVAEAEEDRMLLSSPLLHVDVVFAALHDVGLVIFLLFLVIV